MVPPRIKTYRKLRLGLTDLEHFGATGRTNALSRGFTVLHCDGFRVLHLSLCLTLNAISFHLPITFLLLLRENMTAPLAVFNVICEKSFLNNLYALEIFKKGAFFVSSEVVSSNLGCLQSDIDPDQTSGYSNIG